MLIFLTLTAVVIIACVLCNKLTNKIGIPMLLAFILLGVIFGSDGIFKIHFDDFKFVEQVCTVALIFIMFYGGFGTSWKEAKPVAPQAMLLSSVGVIITSGLTGIFCHFVLGFEWLESLLIGAVLGSTDAASVFSVLRSKQLNLKYRTASLLEVESGSNDPWAYMLTVIILSIMRGENATFAQIAVTILKQVLIGAGLGVLIAWAAAWAVRHIDFETSGFGTTFVVAVAIMAYTFPAMLGGNGYLSTYIVGIILGNCTFPDKKELVHFFDGATGLLQMMVFFLMGLLAFPSQMPQILAPALAIFLFLSFIARPLAICPILTPFGAKISQQIIVSLAGLRGAASIVFAIVVTVDDAYTKNDIFHIVFCVVLLSIGLQGTLLPILSKKLDMIDNTQSVMKTFNDYTEESSLQFVTLKLDADHEWCGKCIREILLPPQMRVIMIRRGEDQVIPKGSTKLEAGDKLIMSAMEYQGSNPVVMKEIYIDKKHKWKGKQLKELLLPHSHIALIRRKEESFVPVGDTQIQDGDMLVVIGESANQEKQEKNRIQIENAEQSDVPEIMELMEHAKNLTENPDWYSTDDENFVRRHISEEGFILKAMEGEYLAGFLIARYPKEAEDNLGSYWNLTNEQMQKVAHMESAAVHPDFRGRGIQKMLMSRAEEIIRQDGYQYLMGTAHPDNVYSVNNFLKLGYEIIMRTEKYGGLPRYVFGKTVLVRTRR